MSEINIPDVPAGELETTVKRAREDGATKIVITKNANGTFAIVVTIP
jgi:hypothetical protein